MRRRRRRLQIDRCIQHRIIDRERSLDEEEEKEATDRCMLHRTIDRERDS